mgnify:FL=1
MQGKSILEAKKITKEYEKGFPILSNLNFTLHQGEFVAVVGESGCGKSTFLHILAGIEPPTEGEVYIDGKNICEMGDEELSKMRREFFSFVYQSDNLVETMTIEENIRLPLVLSKRDKDGAEKARALAKEMGIEDKLSKHPDELSGGEQQRTAIARALITEPKIIFLDEPTASLDKQRGLAVMEMIAKLNKEKGVAVVMVTHSEEQAKFANRIIKVENGQIIDVI